MDEGFARPWLGASDSDGELVRSVDNTRFMVDRRRNCCAMQDAVEGYICGGPISSRPVGLPHNRDEAAPMFKTGQDNYIFQHTLFLYSMAPKYKSFVDLPGSELEKTSIPDESLPCNLARTALSRDPAVPGTAIHREPCLSSR